MDRLAHLRKDAGREEREEPLTEAHPGDRTWEDAPYAILVDGGDDPAARAADVGPPAPPIPHLSEDEAPGP